MIAVQISVVIKYIVVQEIFMYISVYPLTPRSTLENRAIVLYVWGLMKCMTFGNMGKTVYSEKDCNFLESQALALLSVA